jgi:arabinogalactan oligomer/maltooligosaccharide transport system permease protein
MRDAVAFLLLLATLALALPARAETITLWHAYRGDEERALVLVAEGYERAHPGITVELLAIPSEAYAAKLEAAIPRAHGPDLFIQAHQWIGAYLAEQLIAPAGAAFPDADAAGFDAVSVEAVTFRGARWAVPFANKCVALFVNERLVTKTPGTLEGIAALEESLPAGIFPIAYQATNAYYHAPFLHAFGGRLLDTEDHFAFEGQAAARSLSFVNQLMTTGAVPVEPSGALVKQLFVSERAATVLEGPWFAADLGEASGLTYHVEPLPLLAATGLPMRPFLTVEGVFVTPQGSSRAEVTRLARWLGTDDEAAVVRARVGTQVVPLASAWDDAAMRADDGVRLQSLLAFHAAARGAVPMPSSTAMQAAWEPANKAIRKVLSAGSDPTTALDEARRRFEDATRPPPPPASPVPAMLAVGLLLAAAAWTLLRRAQEPSFRAALRASRPAYAYVAHAVLAVAVLVVLPLLAGAATSLFAGRESPHYVGLANYVAILTARGGPLLAHGSFYLTLLVTILWTVVNVTAHVAIGIALGVGLSKPLLRLRAAYRVLLILPWAVPSYVTALAWKGMFHRQFGAANALLRALGAEPVSWFSHFATAFAANVATNVWLGFPFMMVVTMGALTSIPRDVLEAAEVDGASRWQRFRLVTLPLLAPVLLPAVVLGSVWTFNMFNIVFLVSGGEPDGTTDILVSEAYRWAFTRDRQFGYAAAYAVLIFLLLAAGSRFFGKKLTPEAA